MRIVAGLHKGVRLAAPEGHDVRPTSERAREALFNILLHAGAEDGWTIENATVLDLFAGSGALAFEALSRGAKFALLVETAGEARGAIRRNIEKLGAEGVTRLWRRDASKLGPLPAGAGGPFSLIFCDPPYSQGPQLALQSIEGARSGGWLGQPARIVVEISSDDALPELNGLTLIDERVYGAAHFGIFGRSD